MIIMNFIQLRYYFPLYLNKKNNVTKAILGSPRGRKGRALKICCMNKKHLHRVKVQLKIRL
jgi:hypothetical protein